MALAAARFRIRGDTRDQRRDAHARRCAGGGRVALSGGGRSGEPGRSWSGPYRVRSNSQLPTPNSQLPTSNSQLPTPNSQVLAPGFSLERARIIISIHSMSLEQILAVLPAGSG